MTNVKLTTKYKLSKIDKKLIKIMKNIVLNSKLQKNFNYSFRTQKYSITYILSRIIIILKYSISWRHINKYTTFYKRFQQLQQIHLFKNTYIDLLHKYIKKTKKQHIVCSIYRYLYTDTTFIINKKGVDFKKRNKFVKNKNCNKISIIADKNFTPVFVSFYTGNKNDSKILQQDLDTNPVIL